MRDPDVRARLLADRSAAQRRIEALAGDVAAIIEAANGVATDDEHDPEGATLAFEREQARALLGEARDRLGELDRALGRLDLGDYGRCERCGAAIGAERLEARPAARTCIACAIGNPADGFAPHPAGHPDIDPR